MTPTILQSNANLFFGQVLELGVVLDESGQGLFDLGSTVPAHVHQGRDRGGDHLVEDPDVEVLLARPDQRFVLARLAVALEDALQGG